MQGDHDAAKLALPSAALERACELLEINVESLSKALLTAVTLTRGELIERHYTRDQAYGCLLCCFKGATVVLDMPLLIYWAFFFITAIYLDQIRAMRRPKRCTGACLVGWSAAST